MGIWTSLSYTCRNVMKKHGWVAFRCLALFKIKQMYSVSIYFKATVSKCIQMWEVIWSSMKIIALEIQKCLKIAKMSRKNRKWMYNQWVNNIKIETKKEIFKSYFTSLHILQTNERGRVAEPKFRPNNFGVICILLRINTNPCILLSSGRYM